VETSTLTGDGARRHPDRDSVEFVLTLARALHVAGTPATMLLTAVALAAGLLTANIVVPANRARP
jgi:hypothetical protein